MPFLVLLSLAIVLMWTARLARAKTRNPWIWAGVAVVPMLISAVSQQDAWQLLSMVPILVLLFFKTPHPRSSPASEGIACSRCGAGHPHGRYYCTNCGWELNKPYNKEITVPEESPAASTSGESMEPVVASSVAPPVEVADQVSQIEETTSTEVAPPAEEPRPEEAQPEVPAAAPKPVSLGVLTAASMTERGLNLFNLGRFQESIDQFTKAIALDSAYVPAWEARAEAYFQVGREKEAAEDRRRLEGLIPS